MTLIYEKRGPIAYLTINRPEAHNALDPQTAVEMLEAWEAYRDDDECRCAIISGAGEQAFCAGLDLAVTIPLLTGARAPADETERRVARDTALIDRATLRNFELYKPVISAVNGFAIACGMEIVQATDIRVAAENARFGLQEVKWGLFPMGGSTVRLPRQVPYCTAMELMLTGELIDASEALRIGFVNRVVSRDRLMEEAESLATRIAKNGPLAVTSIKKSVIGALGLPIEEGLRRESLFGRQVFDSQDAREGPKAFKEKREPRFRGE